MPFSALAHVQYYKAVEAHFVLRGGKFVLFCLHEWKMGILLGEVLCVFNPTPVFSRLHKQNTTFENARQKRDLSRPIDRFCESQSSNLFSRETHWPSQRVDDTPLSQLF
jgi:hypothetical protein